MDGDSQIQTQRTVSSRKLATTVLVASILLGFLGGFGFDSCAATLGLTIEPQHRGIRTTFGSVTMTNGLGQPLSVMRLDFLLSDIALRRGDGTWMESTNWHAFISMHEQRTSCRVDSVPAGAYDRIRFHVGVKPEINHGDPAKYPANHPLNANLNGLHWTWADGYVFFAIEGHWVEEKNELSGYSYHLGNDPMLMTVELPVALDLTRDTSLQIALNLDAIFDFAIEKSNSSTHSREGDPTAVRLRGLVQKAFSLSAVKSDAQPLENVRSNPSAAPNVSPTAKPYRFTFSSRFPIPDLPRDNPLTDEGVELGRRLFFEKRLSINNSQSCASCHEPNKSFTDSPKRLSTGAEGDKGLRNSMPLFNLAWKKSFFWDGREATLRDQILKPIQNPIEMHETLTNVLKKLSGTDEPNDYSSLFERAFGTSEITSERVSKALEQFLFTQLSFNSKFDLAIEGRATLTDQEKRGFELFMTEYDPRREQFGADCFHCHGGPFFTTHGFANNGLDSFFSDSGRFDATKNESDKGKFSVPSLRNVEVTGPYMHDGRFETLEQVIDHYTTGVKRSTTLDPNLAKHPDGGVPLTLNDKKALVAFLRTLTDEMYRDARPNGDVLTGSATR